MLSETPVSMGWGKEWNLLFSATILMGCASIPRGKYAIDDFEIVGTNEVDDSDIEEKIATSESPRFIGVFGGVVFDYEIYDRFKLQRDLERIERYYRARGFYQARVRAARVERLAPKHVRVVVEVQEGEPVHVRLWSIRGMSALPKHVKDAAVEALRSAFPVGSRFDEDKFAEAENKLKRALTDNAYAFAKVERTAIIDLPDHAADVLFTVRPDRPAVWGSIQIKGLGGLPEVPVRRALDLKPGDPYSTAKLEAAQQAVLDLGVFSSVDLDPLPDPPPEPRTVPVVVTVHPIKLRTVRLGGGMELDVIRTDLHLQAGWQDRNFFGGFREFDVELKPGIVLYPTRLPSLHAPTDVLPEERFRMRFRQPGFLEARTNGLIRGEFNIYPLLLSPETSSTDTVLGYREGRASVGVERSVWKLYSMLTYNVQINFPFAYIGDTDVPSVLISYLDLINTLDFRDDRVHPREGVYFGNEIQVAGGPLLGDTADVRMQPEVRAYVPIHSKLTFAVRASVGFLWPLNYGKTREEGLNTVPSAFTEEQRDRDTQLIFFRGFFSGGPSSNRGYPLRGVGPHGTIAFLVDPSVPLTCSEDSTDSRCSLPLGGFSLWEASTELRFAVGGPIMVALFCDASDVSEETFDVRLNRPHLSCGAGARYDTPVGPVRLDIGYRIPEMQVLSRTDARSEGNPGKIFGLPIAIALGIGEAF